MSLIWGVVYLTVSVAALYGAARLLLGAVLSLQADCDAEHQRL